MLSPIVTILRCTGLDRYEPKFWLNHKGPDGELSFGEGLNANHREEILYLMKEMKSNGLSVTRSSVEEIIGNQLIEFDSSVFAMTWLNEIEMQYQEEMPD
jgi:hypothetical protein